MGYKVILSPQAIRDVERIVRRIAKEDPVAAQRIGYALLDRVMILQNFPLLGSAVPRKSGVRKLLSFPYIIYYRTREKQAAIDILRFWHGARQTPGLH